jgi:hypothetical protein
VKGPCAGAGILPKTFIIAIHRKGCHLFLPIQSQGGKVFLIQQPTLLDAWRKDVSLPEQDFISKYLPGMFSDCESPIYDSHP